MDFLIVNGDIIPEKEANLTPFLSDEPYVISQKIWYGFGGIPLFSENVQSLINQLKALYIEIPEFLKNKRELFRVTKRMLNKNRFYKSGLLNVQLFICNDKMKYKIMAEPFNIQTFPFKKQGLLINVSNIRKDSSNSLYQYPFYNESNWRIAESRLKGLNFQNSVLLNENNMVCEGIRSNIFMIKDNVLVTPAMESGCFEDTLRKPVLEVANELRMKSMELSNIKKEFLFEMNEVFFVSESKGIELILGINNRRFVHLQSDNIYKKLNEYLKRKVN